MRLWIDTDVGDNVDDAIALLLAAAHPAIELVGVSTVAGDLERRAALAQSLLPDVPVAAGLDAGVLAAAAPDALLAIGPLTNVAALTAAGRRPRRVVLMGGALGTIPHRGALRRVEHNFAADPAAAAAVLAVPGTTIVPLDATAATRLDDSGRLRLGDAVPVLAPLLEAWLAEQRAAGVPEVDVAIHLHDPAALLVAAGDDIVKLRETRALAVEPDGRLADAPGGMAHNVVLALDVPAVAARVLGLVEDARRS